MPREDTITLALSLLAAACSGEAQPASPAVPASSVAVTVATAPRPAVSASLPSAAPPSSPGLPPARPLPARAPGELPGRTLDRAYDASELGDRGRAYTTRVFVHDRIDAASETGPFPLVVFFHGLNRDRIPHRWMGGGSEGDVRKILSDLIDEGKVPPVLLAGPGSVQPAAVSGGASFPAFDFDRFLDEVRSALGAGPSFDAARVFVLGHSGAGCSERGGIASALDSKITPRALVSIDTCMPSGLARLLGAAHPETHVVVTWQSVSWDRQFGTFRAVFTKTVAEHPAAPGTLRVTDELPPLPRAHDATVKQTFDKYLPQLLATTPK